MFNLRKLDDGTLVVDIREVMDFCERTNQHWDIMLKNSSVSFMETDAVDQVMTQLLEELKKAEKESKKEA